MVEIVLPHLQSLSFCFQTGRTYKCNIAIDLSATCGFRYLKSPHSYSNSVLWFPQVSEIWWKLYHLLFHISKVELLCQEQWLVANNTKNIRHGQYHHKSHKLHATNVLPPRNVKETPETCNILMEVSCTVKYTVSECIMKVGGGFFFCLVRPTTLILNQCSRRPMFCCWVFVNVI